MAMPFISLSHANFVHKKHSRASVTTVDGAEDITSGADRPALCTIATFRADALYSNMSVHEIGSTTLPNGNLWDMEYSR